MFSPDKFGIFYEAGSNVAWEGGNNIKYMIAQALTK
jgi:hypothetical protein